ncbi:MAG TPA: hypothetical protein VKG82_09865 [Solirubrobacteraceae bacterium]|nr:hypothetical protein [Solirubrobacteraceae bacterium]
MSARAGRGRALARRGRLELLAPSASPEEAAAVVAALERFMRETAPAPATGARSLDGWRRAAILEAVEREPDPLDGHPWINT